MRRPPGVYLPRGMDESNVTGSERRLHLTLGQSDTVTHLEALLEGMLDPVVAIDAGGTIRYSNKACTRTFGYTPEELIGKNVRLLMPEPHRAAHDEYLANYARTGVTHILGHTRELPAVHRNGHALEIELSVWRIEDSGANDVLYCGSIRDITERKRAERLLIESERRFRVLFEQEFHFVGLLDEHGTVLDLNSAAQELAGVPREELLGAPFWEARIWSHSAEEQERVQLAIESARSGEAVRYETTHLTADDRIIQVDFSIKAFSDDAGNLRLLPEGRDITDVQRAREREMAMMRSFAEVGESAALLAHEIKNPITSVNVALRAVANLLGEDEQEVLQDLVERMQKLERLMRRTLSLTRPLEHRPVRCETRALFEGVERMLAPDLVERGVRLEIVVPEDMPPLFVDPDLIEEVLVNLVSNASQAIEGPGLVRVGASTHEGHAVLRVEDDGPGIPDSVIHSLFKPFVSTKATGTGLGLAIARKVVEAHAGKLDAGKSALGGALFEIRLPLHPERPTN